MAIGIKSENDVVTVTLGSKFDFDSVNDFRESYLDAKGKAYIVDFRNTEYMDSSGLGMLLNMRRDLGESAADISLINCRPQVKKILAISRFEKKFTIG